MEIVKHIELRARNFGIEKILAVMLGRDEYRELRECVRDSNNWGGSFKLQMSEGSLLVYPSVELSGINFVVAGI